MRIPSESVSIRQVLFLYGGAPASYFDWARFSFHVPNNGNGLWPLRTGVMIKIAAISPPRSCIRMEDSTRLAASFFVRSNNVLLSLIVSSLVVGVSLITGLAIYMLNKFNSKV